MSHLEVDVRYAFAEGFTLDATFSGREGVTALFGPSGSGKTTLLNCIAGLIAPKTGRIALAGRSLFDSTARIDLPARIRRIGYVFQEHLLFPHLSARRNLLFAARPQGDIREGAVVEVLELGSLLDLNPDQLSGGQRQRVALGRALLSNPDLLLMDEPLASLDAALKDRILGYLQSVVEEFRIPTLFVSHSQAEVRRLANWTVILEAGRVRAEGPPDAVLSEPAALGLHNGLGPVNLLRVDKVEMRDGSSVAHLNGLEIQLPQDRSLGRPPQFVEFDPREVVLATTDVQGVSARNRFHGRVARIVALADRAFVAVDVGPLIWAEVTASAVAELALEPGAPVVCLVKTQSLRLM